MVGKIQQRILVVDNVADAADSMALVLRLWRYDAEACYDGPAALNTARAYKPDVVLLDIGMPKMDGFEVAQRLREQPESRHAVVVAITGYTNEAYRIRAQEMDFHGYFVKPMYPDDLLELLLRVVGPPGFPRAAKADSDGMLKAGHLRESGAALRIPAPRKPAARETLSIIGNSWKAGGE